MFDRGEWLAAARRDMARYAGLRRRIDALEAQAAQQLARTVEAYHWPDDAPVPDRRDSYGVQLIDGRRYGEDLTCELAVANGTSETSARMLAGDVATLSSRLPQCWAKITNAEAPLWHGRSVLDECTGLADDAWAPVDDAVAPCLGTHGVARLLRMTRAAVILADPDRARRLAAQASPRWVRTGADRFDPLTGWISGRLDRADAVGLEETVTHLADLLAVGSKDSTDTLRAKALGLLANPAAACAFIAHAETGDEPEPALTGAAQAWTPRVQVYAHLCVDSLDDPETIARLENIGPLLVEQVAKITQGSRIRLTPAIHIGGAGVAADSYEIPQAIRDRVLLRQTHDVFPWSSIESRHLDLDHSIPYVNGRPGQTTPANLAPLSRRAHRVKTHADWNLRQPSPGEFIWRTGAGQVIDVNPTGTRRAPMRQ